MIKTSAGRVENNAPKDRQGISSWLEFTQSFRAPSQLVVPPWTELFGPLKTGRVDDLVVVAQIGQSLDGRIATASGHSKYINGAAGLVHLHRLRSLVDVVIVGIGTALVDNPQLTVRLVEGPNPARIVIDPKARLPATAKVLTEDGVRRLIITADGTKYPPVLKTEILALPVTGGRIAPATMPISSTMRCCSIATCRLPESPSVVQRNRDDRCRLTSIEPRQHSGAGSATRQCRLRTTRRAPSWHAPSLERFPFGIRHPAVR
jgi:RibD C-terminal domain